MFEAKFPVYAMRSFERITKENGYVLIHTHYTTYILDIPTLEGDYFSRRTQMLGIELPFKVYPLRERFSTLSQVVNSKRREFIDINGRVCTYKPKKFYKIECVRVLRADKTWNGYNLLMTKLPTQFVTEEVGNYIRYIKIGAAYYLYEVCNEFVPPKRKKI